MIHGRERLRDWIARSKVNQSEAARILGIHPVQLSEWLSGKNTPGLKNALHIEQITGISVESWVLSDVQETAVAVSDGDGNS